jgi:hypothetical protein
MDRNEQLRQIEASPSPEWTLLVARLVLDGVERQYVALGVAQQSVAVVVLQQSVAAAVQQ